MEDLNDIKKVEGIAIPGVKGGDSKPDLMLTQTHSLEIDAKKLRTQHIYTEVTDDTSAIAISAYKSLRTRILRTLDAQEINSIMVVGPAAGVGKTLTAINLAVSIARHSRRTALLVDLDLKIPSVHRYFGFEPKGGIVDIITNDIPLESALVSPGIERLTILPGTQGYQDSTELLLSENMQKLIKEIKSRYRERIVIFDTPPVLHCDDVPALVPLMDSCLMVVKEGETQRRELKQALEQLGRINIVGIVNNQSRDPIFNKPYYY